MVSGEDGTRIERPDRGKTNCDEVVMSGGRAEEERRRRKKKSCRPGGCEMGRAVMHLSCTIGSLAPEDHTGQCKTKQETGLRQGIKRRQDKTRQAHTQDAVGCTTRRNEARRTQQDADSGLDWTVCKKQQRLRDGRINPERIGDHPALYRRSTGRQGHGRQCTLQSPPNPKPQRLSPARVSASRAPAKRAQRATAQDQKRSRPAGVG
jgi:hypothetical protein